MRGDGWVMERGGVTLGGACAYIRGLLLIISRERIKKEGEVIDFHLKRGFGWIL